MICRGKFIKGLRTILLIILLSIVIINLYPVHAYSVETAFSDVKSSDYYFEAVQEMAKKGYVKGYGDSTFRPKNNITVAESLTILFRLSGIEIFKSEEPKYWYSDVLDMAINLNIVPEDVNPNDLATRLNISKYIVNLYKLDVSNTTVKNVFADCNLLIANTMYQYGIFIGAPYISADGKEVRLFLPNDNITRGDLCQVLYRLNELIPNPYNEKIVLGEYIINPNPFLKEDYLTIFKYLGENGELEIAIPYVYGLDDVYQYLQIRRNIINAFEETFSLYPEYFSFTPTLNIKREINLDKTGNILITLSNENISNDDLVIMRKDFDLECLSIVDTLFENDILNEEMSEEEKISVLFYYVVTHNSYDTSYSINSFTGYGAAIEGKAVCQGYTAMFNKLCRLLGMDVLGVSGNILSSNESHMWSKIRDEETGIWYYYDTTFADPIPNIEGYCDFSYFHLTSEEILIDRVEI